MMMRFDGLSALDRKYILNIYNRSYRKIEISVEYRATMMMMMMVMKKNSIKSVNCLWVDFLMLFNFNKFSKGYSHLFAFSSSFKSLLGQCRWFCIALASEKITWIEGVGGYYYVKLYFKDFYVQTEHDAWRDNDHHDVMTC